MICKKNNQSYIAEYLRNNAVTPRMDEYVEENQQMKHCFAFLNDCQQWNSFKESLPCKENYDVLVDFFDKNDEFTVPEKQAHYFRFYAFVFKTLISLCEMASKITIELNGELAAKYNNADEDAKKALHREIGFAISTLMMAIADLEDEEIRGIKDVHKELKQYYYQDS